jgi:hypothetical protein
MNLGRECFQGLGHQRSPHQNAKMSWSIMIDQGRLVRRPLADLQCDTVKRRVWGFPVLCGVGMVTLQTGLALYRFGETASRLQWVNPLMWAGLGLFFIAGWLIGLVIERLLRGTTGRFRTLLLVATILATPLAVALSLVGGLFGPPGVLIYGLSPYLLLVGIPRLIGKGWEVWTRRGA